MTRRRGLVRERILRVLLNEPGGGLTKYRLAKRAEASYPWTHGFLRRLESLDLVEGTRVIDLEGAFRFWLANRLRPKMWEYMLRSPLDFLRESRLEYALTTYQGEGLVQRYLFPSRVDFYVRGEDREEWHRMAVEEGLVGGGNVRMLLSNGHVFYGALDVEGFRVVSIPQLIVDLLAEGGVCAEAAERLMEEVRERAV